MSTLEGMAEQRDRFMAFALAGADVMLEINAEDRVVYSFGAVRQMTGSDGGEITGRSLLDIFAAADHAVLKSLMKNAAAGKRSGPVLVKLAKKDAAILFMAIRLPNHSSLYVTLAVPNAVTAPATESAPQELGMAAKQDFVKTAQAAMKEAAEKGQELGMTLIDMPELMGMKARVTAGQWEQAMGMMAGMLKQAAVDGQSVTQISENKYGVLHDKNVSAESIQEKVAGALKEADPEGKGVEVTGSAIDTDAGNLSEAEVSRALMYTLKEFEKKGSELTFNKMDDGFKEFLAENAQKIQRFKSIIANLSFSLYFQPIVSLDTLRASHYEMLTRFRDGTPPYQWVTFGEEVGLAADFDFAVCTRAIKYVQHLPRGTKDKFTVNVSGQSIQSPQFVEKLRALLGEHKALAEQIMFEITESANISDLDLVNSVIGELQKDGFKVCLDDFGAGSASFQYLHKLNVDYVKLDGAYVMSILDNKRNQTMVKSMAQLCHDLNIGMVAERVETEKEAQLLRSLGVGYGQGYWFGKPAPIPDYKVDEKKLAMMGG